MLYIQHHKSGIVALYSTEAISHYTASPCACLALCSLFSSACLAQLPCSAEHIWRYFSSFISAYLIIHHRMSDAIASQIWRCCLYCTIQQRTFGAVSLLSSAHSENRGYFALYSKPLRMSGAMLIFGAISLYSSAHIS